MSPNRAIELLNEARELLGRSLSVADTCCEEALEDLHNLVKEQ